MITTHPKVLPCDLSQDPSHFFIQQQMKNEKTKPMLFSKALLEPNAQQFAAILYILYISTDFCQPENVSHIYGQGTIKLNGLTEIVHRSVHITLCIDVCRAT